MKQLKISNKITDRSSSQSLNHYLSDVRAIKSFDSPQEEYECAVKAFNGDSDALDELVANKSEAEKKVVEDIFISSVEFEYMFWDMAYNKQMSYVKS